MSSSVAHPPTKTTSGNSGTSFAVASSRKVKIRRRHWKIPPVSCSARVRLEAYAPRLERGRVGLRRREVQGPETCPEQISSLSTSRSHLAQRLENWGGRYPQYSREWHVHCQDDEDRIRTPKRAAGKRHKYVASGETKSPKLKKIAASHETKTTNRGSGMAVCSVLRNMSHWVCRKPTIKGIGSAMAAACLSFLGSKSCICSKRIWP
jgi:hypothetical protein